FADGQLLADLGDGQAVGQVGLSLPELLDDLLRRVALPHESSPSPLRALGLSYHMGHFLGSRSALLKEWHQSRLGVMREWGCHESSSQRSLRFDPPRLGGETDFLTSRTT